VSLAWSTIALLIILLPGFLFFVGLYIPEDFTRETAPKSPLGQLAGIVLIAFMVHGTLYAAARSWAPASIPGIRLGYLLQLLQVEGLTHKEFDAIVANMETHPWWILVYIAISSLLGLGIGREVGCLIVAGPLRSLAEHTWVFDLKVEGAPDGVRGICARACVSIAPPLRAARTEIQKWLKRGEITRTVTVAYVLTNVAHDERNLMYRGFLKAFGVSKDGKPLYLVLSRTRRSYLHLKPSKPETSPAMEWQLIGSASEMHADLPGPRLSTYFMVSGDHIVNVVFDRHSFVQSPQGLAALDAAVEKAVAELKKMAERAIAEAVAGTRPRG
jgi:hypothetical protein